MNFSYKAKSQEIERQIREFWSKQTNNRNTDNKPYFHLETFPYPSAAGLHVGHPLGYIASDVRVRFMRMKEYDVLYPFGFDSFGLPAEQFALKTGQHPRVTTEQNIQNFMRQLHVLDLSYDWDRMISTCDPSYYKWTQWIFLKLYNSFFDPTEVWDDGFGHTLQGKAKPITKLVEYLKKSKWHIDQEGIPRPGHSNIKYTDDEIEESLDKARLAYLGYSEVNWCSDLGTVLANEEVTRDGKSERGNFPVEKRNMKQWMLRITDYANRLISGLDTVDWPEKTVTMQKNWIGSSVGMELVFQAAHDIHVFTTRPDTLLGVTFICVSQDHPVYGYKLPEAAEGEKIGHFTGQYATHPITGEKIPIWVANYILSNYGRGAVMGVPAHDERDFEFAKKYGLPIRAAVVPTQEWLLENGAINNTDGDLLSLWIRSAGEFASPYCGEGEILTHEQLGLTIVREFPYFDSKNTMIDYMEEHGLGHKKATCKLRDWVFSRQRYWGEPIPIVYDENGKAYPLDESELPLTLPDMPDFAPPIGSSDPVSPLSKCTDWIKVNGVLRGGKVFTKDIDQTQATVFYREASTMPNWAGSSWYYLRYLDPHNDNELIGKEALERWCKDKYATVDLYVIGAEHTVLHLLYARFWHLFLFDIGCVNNPEPWQKMLHQGMITANAYTDEKGIYVDVNDVSFDRSSGKAIQNSTGKELTVVQGKMGKSYKNGIPPEEICEKHSTDVFRLHMMYMAPVAQTRDWNADSIVGMERFCQSISRITEEAIRLKLDESSEKIRIKLNQVIKLVGEHYDSFHINTAISSIIELCNMIDKDISLSDTVTLLTILAPCAPHLCEYWYQEIRKVCASDTDSILKRVWPKYSEDMLRAGKINVPVKVNDKLKFVLEVDRDIEESDLNGLIQTKLQLNDLNGYKEVIVRKEGTIRMVNLVKR